MNNYFERFPTKIVLNFGPTKSKPQQKFLLLVGKTLRLTDLIKEIKRNKSLKSRQTNFERNPTQSRK